MILKNPNDFKIKNSVFLENNLYDNIKILNSKFVNLMNVSCIKNNKQQNNTLGGGGTCFVFRYVETIDFDYVSIIDSFSNYTTVGVKLIESKVKFFISILINLDYFLD